MFTIAECAINVPVFDGGNRIRSARTRKSTAQRVSSPEQTLDIFRCAMVAKDMVVFSKKQIEKGDKRGWGHGDTLEL